MSSHESDATETTSPENILGGPDETLRVKVDPWTGKVLPEFPNQSPAPLDPDRTHRVVVNPQTGVLVGRPPRRVALRSEPPRPVKPERAAAARRDPPRLELGLPAIGIVATLAMTAGAAAGALITLFVLD